MTKKTKAKVAKAAKAQRTPRPKEVISRVHDNPRPLTRAVLHGKGSDPKERVQWARVQAYAVDSTVVSRGGVTARTQTVRDIIGELTREDPVYYQHLTTLGLEAKPPIWLGGAYKLDELVPKFLPAHEKARQEWADEHKTTYTYKRGEQTIISSRGGSTIQPSVLAEVVGYPGPANDDDPDFVAWKQRNIHRAYAKWGKDNVMCMALHVDEGAMVHHFNAAGEFERQELEVRTHLHILIASPKGAPAATLHQGRTAKRGVEGGRGEQSNAAYKEAMSAYQDEFYEMVSKHCNLKRRAEFQYDRHAHKEAMLRKQLGREVSKLDHDYEQERKQIAVDREEASKIRAEAEGLVASAKARENKLNAMELAMLEAHERRVADIDKRLAALDARHEQMDNDLAAMRLLVQNADTIAQREIVLRQEAEQRTREAWAETQGMRDTLRAMSDWLASAKADPDMRDAVEAMKREMPVELARELFKSTAPIYR